MSEPVDILANAIVAGPNMLPLDPSAAPAVAPEPAAETPEPTTDPSPESPEGDTPPADEPAETEEPPETPDGETPPRRRRNDVNVRFSELTAARKAAEDRAKFLEDQAEFWRQQAQAQPPRPLEGEQGVPAAPDGGLQRAPDGRPLPPDPSAFVTHADYEQARNVYTEALTDYKVTLALAQERQQRAQDTALAAVRQQYPDYDTVMQQAAALPINRVVGAAILHSPDTYAVRYYLATHPEEAQALLPVQDPAQALLAVGMLQARALGMVRAAAPPPASEPAPEPNGTTPETIPPLSTAPPPITPTRATGGRVAPSLDELPIGEYIVARNKQEMGLRR